MTLNAQLTPPDAFGRFEARLRLAKTAASRYELDALGRRMEAVVRSVAPTTGKGEFVRGLTHDLSGAGDFQRLTVTSTAADKKFVEEGRRPGKMPRVEVIAQVLGLEPSQAFVVARTIGERGTKGHHVFEQAGKHLDMEARRTGATITAEVAKAL